MRIRPPALAHLRYQARADELAGLDAEPLFTEIWRSNLWGAEASRSGLGSQGVATSRLEAELPKLFARHGIRTLLDLPCGDFGWMRRVCPSLDHYLGADIVAEIVAQNAADFVSVDGRVGFVRCDLLTDPLPVMDAVLCRDCLVHLSYANIAKALANLRRSGSRWLLATTFPDQSANIDIANGDWRPVNLEAAPFHLAPPVEILNEGCEEAGGGYSDKSLGLWRLADTREVGGPSPPPSSRTERSGDPGSGNLSGR
jgi:hypothetical protein